MREAPKAQAIKACAFVLFPITAMLLTSGDSRMRCVRPQKLMQGFQVFALPRVER